MAKRKAADAPHELALSGELCLAFVNTVARRPDERYSVSDPPPEATAPVFADYGGLVAWGRRMGVLEPDDTGRLERAVSERPDEALAVFARAVALREALGRIFTALATTRKPPSSADLDVLNGTLIRPDVRWIPRHRRRIRPDWDRLDAWIRSTSRSVTPRSSLERRFCSTSARPPSRSCARTSAAATRS